MNESNTPGAPAVATLGDGAERRVEQATAAARGEPLQHATKDNGDCPHWCKACAAEDRERGAPAAGTLHQQIMNLPCNELHAGSPREDVQRAYGEGFKAARHAAAELVAGAAGTAVPEQQWQPIATAPKDVLVDIWIPHADGNGVRWAGAHYDRICDEWRVSTPGERVRWVKASAVSHWRLPPAGPGTPGAAPLPAAPLTDEQIKSVWNDCGRPSGVYVTFARAIERAVLAGGTLISSGGEVQRG